MLNQQIGSYKIISELGEGGMAMVYLAEKGTLGKQVALKVLKKEFLYNQHIRGRFLSEAKKMINLNHPNIVGVQDLIDESDFVAIELEYVEGKTLKHHLNDHGALPDDEIEHLFKQMLDAVGYIHAKGYIHRDIKPSNFMLTQSGIIKLTDFGIAKNADDTNIDYTGTGTGMQMGTPKYMSPEQVRSTKDVDHRSDIYSLGVVLWEMVTGKVPYDIETESTFDVFRKIVDEPLEPTDTRWDKVIEKCTNKNIEYRYQKVDEIKVEKREKTISQDPSGNTDKILTPTKGGIDSTDKKKSYSFKAPIIILFIIVGFVLLKFFLDSYKNNMNAEDSRKVTDQVEKLPQWKVDFEERWEGAVSKENMNNAQNNHENFSELLTILPEEAEEERNRVQLKLDEYSIGLNEESANTEGYTIDNEYFKFETYCNVRFGFCIDYPSGRLFPQGESGNGDGQIFKSKNAATTMWVYRDFRDNEDPDSKFDIESAFILDTGVENPEKSKRVITYKKLGKNFYVISGYNNEKIFYQKTINTDAGLATSLIEYPESEKDYYNKVSETIFQSFK